MFHAFHFRCIHLLLLFCSTVSFAQIPPSVPLNQLQLQAEELTVRFEWLGDSLNGQWEPHAALLLPIQLTGYPQTVYLQFDTGASTTVLYRHALRSTPLAVAPDSAGYLKNVRFHMGSTDLVAHEIRVMDIGNAHTASEKPIIGTIGMDLLEDRIVILDYPHQTLSITGNIPRKWRKATPDAIVFSRHGILIPASIREKNQLLYFDSGSSAFALLTDSTTCAQLADPDAVWKAYPVGSWGNMLTAHSVATPDVIHIAGQTFPIERVTYIEGVSSQQVQQMRQLGISGMIGNQLFLNCVLVIDTRRQQCRFIPTASN